MAALIPAAGAGRRYGFFKPFQNLAGEPILLHALRPFLQDSRVKRVVIALPAEYVSDPPDWMLALDNRIALVAGGEERGDSVRNALRALPDDIDVVLVHDAARPLVSAELVDRAIRAAAAGESVVAALPATDTLQQVDAGRRIIATPDRAVLWQAQTPQAFPRAVIMAAYERAAADGVKATDDAAVVLRNGGVVRVIEGERTNIKITVPSDLAVAEALLRAGMRDA